MKTKADLPIILLLEGDTPTAKLYRRELSADRCVLVCLTTAEAQPVLADTPLAAAVIEPAESGLEGWDMVARLVERGVPVIVCSTLDERRKGLELGVSHYLVKPVLPSALLQALRDVLRASSGSADRSAP